MIALAIAAAIALRFAPPPDDALHYRLVDRTTSPRGSAVVETDMTLRFRAGPHGLVASATSDAVRIAAPPRQKRALAALTTPLIGVPIAVEVAADGAPGAPIDDEAAWAAMQASRRALLQLIEADTQAPPAALAAGRASLLRQLEPGARDEQLRAAVAQLLPPAVGALAPGGSRLVAATLPTPGGPLPAVSTIRLEAATAAALTYRIETATVPQDPATMPGFAEVSTVSIDPRTGLLRAFASRREVRRPGQPPGIVSARTIDLAP